MVVFNYLDSDNILNRGTVVNDNTGDTLRAAALKINVNFETVDSALGLMQSQITTNDSDITSLQSQINANDSDITSLQSQITGNDSDILNLVLDSNGIGAGAVTTAKLGSDVVLGTPTGKAVVLSMIFGG